MKTVIEMAREAGILVPRPCSVSNEENQMDDLTLPVGYLDKKQLLRWEALRGTAYEMTERGYVPFSRSPHVTDHTDCSLDVYTADQMRMYAKRSVEAEREACAKVCDDRAIEYDGLTAEQNAAEKLAAAIRARSRA